MDEKLKTKKQKTIDKPLGEIGKDQRGFRRGSKLACVPLEQIPRYDLSVRQPTRLGGRQMSAAPAAIIQTLPGGIVPARTKGLGPFCDGVDGGVE